VNPVGCVAANQGSIPRIARTAPVPTQIKADVQSKTLGMRVTGPPVHPHGCRNALP